MIDDRFPDLVGWCGHPDVDLKTWQCPDCNTLLPDTAKARLLSAETIAPPGYVWVLNWLPRDGADDEGAGPILGVFSDRSKISRLFVRQRVCDPAHIRQIHWYQCAYNHHLFTGWDEYDDEDNHSYYLSLDEIDRAD